MPATDNKFPITYDGSNLSSVLPSFNPFEGKPIRSISAADDLSAVCILEGPDHWPWMDGYIASPFLIRRWAPTAGWNPIFDDLNGLTQATSGEWVNLNGSPVGFASGGYSIDLRAWAKQSVGGSPQIYYMPLTNSGNNYVSSVLAKPINPGSIVELDEVFHSIYIRDWAGLTSQGIYSFPCSGSQVHDRVGSAGIAARGRTTLRRHGSLGYTVAAPSGVAWSDYGGVPPVGSPWSDGWDGTNYSYRPTSWRTGEIPRLSKTLRLGSIEGWHFVPNVMIPMFNGPITIGNTNTMVCFDYTQASGAADGVDWSLSFTIAPLSMSILKKRRLATVSCVYVGAFRPNQAFWIGRKSGPTYSQETLTITQTSQPHGSSNNITEAKAISLSPNGKYIMLASDTGQFTTRIIENLLSSPRFSEMGGQEKVYLFKHVFVGPGFAWRNAYLANGATPSPTSLSDIIAGQYAQYGSQSGWDARYNQFQHQFHTISVTDSADWAMAGNFGSIKRGETQFDCNTPTAPRSFSKNLLHTAIPDPGTEYGAAGSPTIATAVSSNGVVVKANRVVDRGYSVIPISSVSGTQIILSQPHGIPSERTFYIPDDSSGYNPPTYYDYNNAYVAFDSAPGGSTPVVQDFAAATIDPAILSHGAGFNTSNSWLTAPGHNFIVGTQVECTAATGSLNSNFLVGGVYYVLQVSGIYFRLGLARNASNYVLEFYPSTGVNLRFKVASTVGSGGTIARGIAFGARVVNPTTIEVAQELSSNASPSISFSSAGSSARLIIYRGDAATNTQGSLATANSTGKAYVPAKKSSNVSINSYNRAPLYATVTIDGQQVLPTSPTALENCRYGAFGHAVAIDDSGSVAAVANPSEGYSEAPLEQPEAEGAVYLYQKQGLQWVQTNRITVPRILDYNSGELGTNMHVQFGSALAFSGGNLLIGSRQGVYVYELWVNLSAAIPAASPSNPESGNRTSIVAQLEFVLPLTLVASVNTKTTILQSILEGAYIDLTASLEMPQSWSADLGTTRDADIQAGISSKASLLINLVIANKVNFGLTRLEPKTSIAAILTTLTNTRCAVLTSTSLSAVTTGQLSLPVEINGKTNISANLIKFVPIVGATGGSMSLGAIDDLLRINPLPMQSSIATYTSISPGLGYIFTQLQAVLSKATRISASAAKLTSLGTTDERQASIFEAGRPGAGTIGNLSQRWVKRSDLQNNDIVTSVEWVEGEPPQLD